MIEVWCFGARGHNNYLMACLSLTSLNPSSLLPVSCVCVGTLTTSPLGGGVLEQRPRKMATARQLLLWSSCHLFTAVDLTASAVPLSHDEHLNPQLPPGGGSSSRALAPRPRRGRVKHAEKQQHAKDEMEQEKDDDDEEASDDRTSLLSVRQSSWNKFWKRLLGKKKKALSGGGTIKIETKCLAVRGTKGQWTDGKAYAEAKGKIIQPANCDKSKDQYFKWDNK